MELRTIKVTRTNEDGSKTTYEQTRYLLTEAEKEEKKKKRLQHAKNVQMRLDAPNIPSAKVADIIDAFEDLCNSLEWD